MVSTPLSEVGVEACERRGGSRPAIGNLEAAQIHCKREGVDANAFESDFASRRESREIGERAPDDERHGDQRGRSIDARGECDPGQNQHDTDAAPTPRAGP